MKFIKLAEKEGYKVKVYDPYVKEFEYEYEILGLEEAVKGSDCIVLITDYPEFKAVAPEGISRIMRNTNIVDTRNMWDTK